MKTNLIQSYLNGTQNQQYVSNKTAQDFDINKELTTRTFIRPLPSHGHLVSNNIFDIPSEFFKDVQYDINALGHSAKGKANDHELGRLNDIGMKLGGLAIAGYLFTKKQTPLTKVMEFVGLGSFFASMNIWPKVALQLPAYLIHGVNVRQEYVDNYGRKKLFYLDNQFIPWSLYSDEKIDKIGDRMGVPKDMQNRRDFIQEKMRKIALQNNTMWMLTSGFATPIMSALICNGLTKPIAHYQEKIINNKADNMMKNFDAETEKIKYTKNDLQLAEILRTNDGKPITRELIEQLHANLSEGIDAVTGEYIKKDLEELLAPKEAYNITEDTLGKIRLQLEKNFSDLDLNLEQLDDLIPKQEDLAEAFRNEKLPFENVSDFSRHTQVIQDLLEERINTYIAANPEGNLTKDLKFIMKNSFHSPQSSQSSAITKILKLHNANVLDEETANIIRDVSQTLNGFRAKTYILDKFAYIKAGQAPETILADTWNNITDGLLKTFDITDAKIKRTRFDRELVGEMLRNSFEQIAANEDLYKRVVSDIEQKLIYLEDSIESLDKVNESGNSHYRSAVISTYDDTAASLRESNFGRTAQSLVGYDSTRDLTSAKNVQLSFMESRITGVRSSFYRILNTLDMYRRIATLENIDHYLPERLPRQVKEEVVEMCKQLLIDGHMADYAVKFSERRIPELNPVFHSDAEKELFYSKLEVDDAGRVINRFLGSENAGELAELVHDRNFYKLAMELMYGEGAHSDTTDLIKNSVVKKSFAKYKKDILTFFGGDQYFAKPNHLVGEVRESTSERRFLMTGCALDEMFAKLLRQKYNSNKWLKIFGTLGGGLLGVTVLSQFFFGRMKKPKGEK